MDGEKQMNPTKGKSSIAAVMVLWAWTACSSAEFNYASYIETTLQGIITEERNHSIDSADQKKIVERVEIECRTAKYRVSCNYAAVRRPISGKNLNVIKLWVKTLQIDPELASLYRQEIKVTEGMNVHWIPVQENLLSHIDRELRRNDAMELFILFLGKNDSEYVFIATEYNAIVPNPGKPDLTKNFVDTRQSD
jgi:hypothetical protein